MIGEHYVFLRVVRIRRRHVRVAVPTGESALAAQFPGDRYPIVVLLEKPVAHD
jgi:hypothetical protein